MTCVYIAALSKTKMDQIPIFFVLPWFCGSGWAGTKPLLVKAARLDTAVLHLSSRPRLLTHFSHWLTIQLWVKRPHSWPQAPLFSESIRLLQYLPLKYFYSSHSLTIQDRQALDHGSFPLSPDRKLLEAGVWFEKFGQNHDGSASRYTLSSLEVKAVIFLLVQYSNI